MTVTQTKAAIMTDKTTRKSLFFAHPVLGWVQLVSALAAGLVLRLIFIHFYAQTAGDTFIYGDIAKNLLQHGIYGLSGNDGPTPALLRLPGYPLLLAACFKLFGMEHYTAVMRLQCVADLGTCVLVALTAVRLFGRRAGICSLWLAVLCPFSANYVATPLTETMSLFCIALACYALVQWSAAESGGPLRLNRYFWAMAVAMAYAILLRPDGGLLPAAIVPAVAWIAWTRCTVYRTTVVTRAYSIGLTMTLSIAVLLPLVPWTVRNMSTFHVFQPLAPRYANDPGEIAGFGFNHWYRSWAVEYKSTEDVYWNLNDSAIQIEDLPQRAFDSAAQYAETSQLLDDYNDTLTLTRELDDRFQHIADERIAANPMNYYVTLPAERLADMWLRPRTEMLPVSSAWWQYSDDPKESLFAIGYGVLNLLYILAAGFGAFTAWRWFPPQKRPLLYAMLAYLVLRSALLFTLDNSEQRYTLEFFPLFFVLGGFCLSSCPVPRQLTHRDRVAHG
jgi:4-amino-4-deoxy-L-arabinose transferase-like glycosyltransferase